MPASRLRRFIPACAGNGVSNGSTWHVWSVHPRVCGERELPLPDDLANKGSSPRVRGTAPTVSRQGRSLRFIPACAGNGLITTS